MTEQSTPPLVHCPRCGYDQRGVVATWRDSCPLQTSCTECGLLIEWTDLLSPRRKYPRWCLEYGRGIIDAIRRFFLTIALTFWPWKMWRSLQMWHEIRWGRLLRRTLLVLLAALMLLYAAARINPVLALHLWILPSHSGTTSVRIVDSMVTSVLAPWSTQSPGTMSIGYFAPGLATGPNAPSRPVRVFTFEYPAPRRLQETVADLGATQPWYGRRYHYDDAWRLAGSASIYATVLTALIPLVFAILPASRKQAKVRWVHVWRVAIYNALWLLCLLMLIGMAELLVPWDVEIASMILSRAGWILIIWPVASVLFWQAAIRNYLKMSRSWAVALSTGAIAWLASSAATYYINNPMSADEMWEWTQRVFK